VLLGTALWLVNGFALHVGACDLDGRADSELVAVGTSLENLVPLGAAL